MGDDDIDSMEQLAAELRFDASGETIERSIESARDLERTATGLFDTESPVDDLGRTGDDDYGAFLTVYDEPRRGAHDGPLAGLTFGVKDNIAVENLGMTGGSKHFSIVPSRDATAVDRLLENGASIVGKTNMDAFGFGPSGEFSDFGAVTNPIDADRVPGGSSSGSGAAVAAGLVDFALGSDTGGSVRIPAACCGVVGAKPSRGLVPNDGFVNFAQSLDTIGPLAHDVETAAGVLEAMRGHTPRDPTTSRYEQPSLLDSLDSPGELTFGLPEPFFEHSASVVSEAVEALADALAELSGIRVRRIDLDLGDVQDAYFLLSSAEFVWYYRQSGVVRGLAPNCDEAIRAELADMRERGVDSQHLAWRVLPPARVDEKLVGRGYAAAKKEAMRFQREIDSHFESVDLLLAPTIRDLPPEHGRMDSTTELLNLLGNTAPFNLTGMPAVSVPIEEVDGLPISAQIVAPAFADHRALAGARLVERVSS